MTDREQRFAEFLRMRGVETPCSKCGGLGTHIYGSTSTWRGGIGGCMCTKGVCNHCWGSGDEHRHGDDLRAFEARIKAQREYEVAEYVARATGTWLPNCYDGIEAVCQLLDDASKSTRRKPRPSGFDEACHILSSTLRCGIEEDKRRRREEK